jgi:hypothetical protein
MTALAIALLLCVAQAGTLYVNGTPVEGLKSYAFEQVDVRVDEHGNIWIDAPKYNVSLGEEAKGRQSTGGSRADSNVDSDLPRGSWWLVSEDQGSTGHKIAVMINGQTVKTVESGGRQVIFDISPYLHKGTNVVTFRNSGANSPGGAALEIMLGPGSIVGSKVTLDRPKLTYKRNSASPGGESDDNQTLVID